MQYNFLFIVIVIYYKKNINKKNEVIMIIRKIVFVLSAACLLFSLNSCKSGGKNADQITTEDNSQTALDWAGTYSGIIPCADCAGIETQISLNMDNTYQINWKYLDKSDETYTQEGTFTWDCTGSFIILENAGADYFPSMYKVCEGYLLQLDMEGNVITGELADNYKLVIRE
jgi:uncharacterized lipoprotein NlpE involved in copper resistance